MTHMTGKAGIGMRGRLAVGVNQFTLPIQIFLVTT